MYKFVVILFLSSALALEDCGSKPGVLQSVSVSGCQNDNVCKLRRSKNVTINISFKSVDSKKITTNVSGRLRFGNLDTTVPFLMGDDGCESSGIKCPLSAENIYDYHYSVPILRAYPSVPVQVKWELIDDKGEHVVCVIIPAKIV